MIQKIIELDNLQVEESSMATVRDEATYTLNKNYIRIELEKALGEQSDKIDSCMDNILNNRSVKITHILRKVKS